MHLLKRNDQTRARKFCNLFRFIDDRNVTKIDGGEQF